MTPDRKSKAPREGSNSKICETLTQPVKSTGGGRHDAIKEWSIVEVFCLTNRNLFAKRENLYETYDAGP